MSRAADLNVRVVTGLLLILGASVLIYFGGGTDPSLGPLTWIGPLVFRIVVAVLAAFMLLEWNAIHAIEPRRSRAVAILLALCLPVIGQFLFPIAQSGATLTPESFRPALLGFGIIAAAGLGVGLVLRRAAAGVGLIYIGIPALSLIVLEWGWEMLTFWVMIVTWSTDIFAYFFGRAIGGPKLAPRISPNKTWSGLIGGVLGATAFGWIFAYFMGLGGLFLLAGAPMAVLAQAGDLFESWVKRRAGVKDSGSILPGHGGLLDRLDGLLPLLVVTVLILMSGYWP